MDLGDCRASSFRFEKPFFDEMEAEREKGFGEYACEDEVCGYAVSSGCDLPARGQDMRDAHPPALSSVWDVLRIRRRVATIRDAVCAGSHCYAARWQLAGCAQKAEDDRPSRYFCCCFARAATLAPADSQTYT